MNVKYKHFLAFLLFTAMLTLSACQSKNSEETRDMHGQGENTLKVYINNESPSDSSIIYKAINMFKEKNSEVEFIINNIESFDGYSKRLSTELMAGEGPDVLLINNYIDLPLHKIMNSEALLNLNEFIKDDKLFDNDDYNKVVMDSGVYKGKRFLLPISYRVSAFITTESLLSNNDFQIRTDNWTQNNLIEQVNRLKTRDSNDGKIYYSYRRMLFRDWFNNTGHKYIDYEKGKVSLNTTEFIEILNNYKKLQDINIPRDEVLKYNGNIYNIMKDNKLIAYDSDDLLSPKILWSEANNAKYYLGAEVKLYPSPTIDGSRGYAAEPESMLAINNNCKNKQLAYSFIKTFLTEDFQVFETENGLPIPVNKKAYEKLLKQYMGEEGTGKKIKSFDGNEYLSEPLSPTLNKEVHDIVDNISICEIYNKDVMNMILKELSKFVNDNCTVEEAAEQMERKLRLYLNE